ncbi:outer membrane protein assembly factor BamB family protein [Streptomyces sp. NPDC002514]|uniref:outer membrane protein assembly factor BamB family protein n=1 Tax=Streptomyces sp. NPDC001270 TaxID=3364554 RepID=UPI0036CFFA8A
MAGRTDLRRQAESRRQWAQRQGWTYDDEQPALLERRRDAVIGAATGEWAARFAVSGPLEGRKVTVFDCVNSAPARGWSRQPRYGVQTVLLVELSVALPLTAVSKHGLAVDTMVPLLKQVVRDRPDRHLHEIGDPAYDQVHVVETADPAAAERLLTPAVREFADDRAWLAWRVDGEHLCHVRPPETDPLTHDDAALLEELRSLVRLADLVDPRPEDEAHAGTPAPAVRRPAVPPSEDTPATAPTAAAPATTAPATMYRGDAAHTGVFPDGRPPAGFEAWSVALGGPVSAEPVVSAGTVLVNCTDGDCYALDAITGEPRWRFAARSRLTGSPAVAGGQVFVVGADGVLHAIGVDDGQERWQRTVGRSAAPVPDGGLVYVVHNPARALRDASGLRALDAATGEPRWESPLPDGSASGPAVADGRVHVHGATGALSAFDARSGQRLWHHAGRDTQLTCCTPSVVDGTLYVGTGRAELHAYDAATGEHRWGSRAAGVIDATPAVSGGLVLVGDSHGGAYACRADSGRPVWQLPSGYGASSVTISGRSAWLVTAKAGRRLLKVALADGAVRWRHALDDSGTSPAFADGIVYVGTGKGTLLALDADTGRGPRRGHRRLPL